MSTREERKAQAAAAREWREACRAAGTPQPDPRPLVPHPEDFAGWVQHPITRFVATALQAAALKQREAWFDLSWTGGNADPDELNRLRTRADAYMAFLETTLDEYAKLIEA